MSNQVVFKVDGLPDHRVYNKRDVAFSLVGLRDYLNRVTIREGYFEGEYGDEVLIPASQLLWYTADSRLEVVSE